MTTKLFTYGTLQPGQENEHYLKKLSGHWQKAWVKGTFIQEGTETTEGYPALFLDEQSEKVEGMLFESHELDHHWPILDAFEGEGYRRILVKVQVADANGFDEAYVYEALG